MGRQTNHCNYRQILEQMGKVVEQVGMEQIWSLYRQQASAKCRKYVMSSSINNITASIMALSSSASKINK